MTTSGRDHRPVALPEAPAIPGLGLRHFEPAHDYPALAELWTATNLDDGMDWVVEPDELRHQWEHTAGFEPDGDVLVAELAGGLAGFVEHRWRQRGQRVFHDVRPVVRQRNRRHGLGRALLAWAEERAVWGKAAGTMGPVSLPHVLAVWADREVGAGASFAAAAGYVVDGYGVLMSRSLLEPIPDAKLPEGLEIRPVRAVDHRRIWDADVEAFRDHRDPAVRTEPTSSGGSRRPTSTRRCGTSPGTATRLLAPCGTWCSQQRTSAWVASAGSSSTSRSAGRGAGAASQRRSCPARYGRCGTSASRKQG